MFEQLYTFMAEAGRWLDSIAEHSLDYVLLVMLSPAIAATWATFTLRESLSWREPPRGGFDGAAFRLIQSRRGAAGIAAAFVLNIFWCALLFMLRIVTAIELGDMELGVSHAVALARKWSPGDVLTFLPPAFAGASIWGLYLLPRAHRHCASLASKANA